MYCLMALDLTKISDANLEKMANIFDDVASGYLAIQKRLNVPYPSDEYTGQENIFYLRFWSEFKTAETSLRDVTNEIRWRTIKK